MSVRRGGHGHLLPAAWLAFALMPAASSAQLDEQCTASVLNRTTLVRPDGSWSVPNIPAVRVPIHARATCLENGTTRSSESPPFTLPSRGFIEVPNATFSEGQRVPESVRVSADRTVLTSVGEAAQLTVTATFPGGSTADVTASASGTGYVSTSPWVASVDSEGLVTALSSGTVLVSASNGGTLGLIRLLVVLSGDTDGDGIPDDLEVANGLNPNDPVDGLEDPDDDGLSNKNELVDFGTNPFDADTDGDGIEDLEELFPGFDGFVTNPLLFDTDGDGIGDGLEVATGTDPTDPASFDLEATLVSIEVDPPLFAINVNTLFGQLSRQLTVTGSLIDGSTIDLTSTLRGTTYRSSDLTVCNFGAMGGEIFPGRQGKCIITATNLGFETSSEGFVHTFTPEPTFSTSILGNWNAMAIAGDRLYVGGQQFFEDQDTGDLSTKGGLWIWQIEDGTLSQIEHTHLLGGAAPQVVDIKVDESLVAYLATVSGLFTLETDGTQARTLCDPHLQIVDPCDNFSAADLALDGDLLFTVGGISVEDRLKILDVSDPAYPSLIGSVQIGLGLGVAVDPERELAVVVGADFVKVVDYSDPTMPFVVGTSVDGCNDCKDVEVRDGFAFVASGVDGFVSYDLSDPTDPMRTGNASGIRLNDVAAVGQFGFGADFNLVNAVPILDLTDPAFPTRLFDVDFSNDPVPFRRSMNGQDVEADEHFLYMAGRAFDSDGVPIAGLFVARYREFEDEGDEAPVVDITDPLPGSSVVEGTRFSVTVEATDDVKVLAVELIADGEVVRTDFTAPYGFSVEVPLDATSVELQARALDRNGNVALSASLTVDVLPDPRTTVTGFVQDDQGNPIAGAVVGCLGFFAFSAADGSFSVEDVPTAQGDIQCIATVITGEAGRLGVSTSVPTVPSGITDLGSFSAVGLAPTIAEPGWTLTRIVPFTDPQAAHYNPVDGKLYVARRSSGDGVFRIEDDGSATLLTSANNPAAIVIDPDTGDIFHSEDFGGSIFRTGFGETGRTTWVSGLHGGDDDPIGMAVAPNDHASQIVLPGQALVVDRGFNGPDEIWTFSPDGPEGEQALHSDNGTLVDAFDITMDSEEIFVADARGADDGVIYRVGFFGALTPLATGPIADPVGITIDPQNGDFLVLDAANKRLVRVNRSTGIVTNVVTHLRIVGDAFAGIDTTPDGERIFISDAGADVIYEYSRIEDPGTSVVGEVVDAVGNPVEGATVNCLGVGGTTDALGQYAIDGVPALLGLVRCTALYTAADGFDRSGASAAIFPVFEGVTDVGRLLAVTIYSEDFQFALGPEWSSTATSVSPAGRRFLGQLGNQSVSLNLIGLPPHAVMSVRADLFVIRTWDGNTTSNGPDFWELGLDGASQFRTTFVGAHAIPGGDQSYPQAFPGGPNPAAAGASEINALGFVRSGQIQDLVYRPALTFARDGETVSFDFSASGLQTLSDESWGLDNVAIDIAPLPPPGADIDLDNLLDLDEIDLGPCVSPFHSDTDGNGIRDDLDDCDADGLDNRTEVEVTGTDLRDGDTDGDTIGDFEESVVGEDGFVTDPTNPDTDLDGALDQEEIEFGSDPTDPASLPEGVGDLPAGSTSSRSASVLNEVDPPSAPSGDPGTLIEEARGRPVSVSNEIDPLMTPAGDPGELISEARGKAVSVLNEFDPIELQSPGESTNGTATGSGVSVENQAGP